MGYFGLFSTRKDNGGPKLRSMGFGEVLGLMGSGIIVQSPYDAFNG